VGRVLFCFVSALLTLMVLVQRAWPQTGSGASGNLIVNGSFEGTTYTGPNGDIVATGWTLLPTNHVSLSDFNIESTVNPLTFQGAEDGTHYAAFRSRETDSSQDCFVQFFDTIPGQQYTVSFWVAITAASVSNTQLLPQWDWQGAGQKDMKNDFYLAPTNTGPVNYRKFTFTETASSNRTGLMFHGTDSNGAILLDNVVVTRTSQVSSATHFVPVTPCRVADTRNPNGPFGGPAISAGTFRDFVIPNSACGIPSAAAAYSMTVAVVPSGELGYVTLWPSGQSQPLVATLNSIDGRVKSNAAIVPAGSNGAVSVFATDTTDVILDINGYFIAGSNAAALAFYPLTPCRVADTRDATAPLGGPSLAPQSIRSFPIQASPCGVPAAAQGYSLNFAAVPKGSTLGFLTAWPAGQSQPLLASLNDPTGTVLANAVVVPAGAGGAVNVFTADNTDLVIDINGFFAPQGPGGLSLFTVPPCRVLDSRLPAGTPPFSTTQDVNLTASPCGVPVTAQAYVFNATVVPPGPLGFITMWPQGQTQPLAATLNATDGAITNNMAIVPTTTGSVSVFPSSPTHLVLDIFGYFAP
jgi:hypothetical protein